MLILKSEILASQTTTLSQANKSFVNDGSEVIQENNSEPLITDPPVHSQVAQLNQTNNQSPSDTTHHTNETNSDTNCYNRDRVENSELSPNRDNSNVKKSLISSESSFVTTISGEINEHDAKNPDDSITILHFNDCYNVEPTPESSGAAGFLTAINERRRLDPMILFSGDIISPSFMSTFTKGEQMIPVLNDIGVHCAVFGNHEFDYGVDNLIDFTKRTSFPWLLSNVIDKETSNQLGDGEIFYTIERSGVKFGLIGLIEEEWLSTLSTLDSSDVIYQDFVERGEELAKMLKGQPHCVDFVIALTHCRTPNDIRLADSVPEIDLILGGHDHDYEIIKRANCFVVKSGTDFREFSEISLKINTEYLELKRLNNFSKLTGLKPITDIEIKRIDCSAYLPDVNLKQKLEKFVTTIDEKMGKVLGQFNCELDGRFSSIRKYETNLGNFVTDIMLASTHADLAILNSGTLRSDRIHPKGDFTMRDLFNILGYIDPIAVLQASGQQIWRALENGVSQWPRLEGRFPQVSGCTFLFDPSKPPMQRIDPKNITIGEEPLDLGKHYKLTTKAYLASGKDGYDALKECKVLVPGDESPDLTTSILNHFEAINIVKSNRRTHHRQSIICLSRSSIKRILNQSTSSPTSCYDNNNLLSVTNKFQDNNNNTQNNGTGADRQRSVDEDETAEQLIDTNNTTHASSTNETHFGDELQSPEIMTKLAAGGKAPAASSPLAGVVAPTPKLRNMVDATPPPLPPTSGNGTATATATDGLATDEQPSPLSTIQKRPRTKRLMSLYEMEHEQCKLEPKVEGRIKILGVNA